MFNRPVGSAPGGHIQVMERVSTDGNKTLRMTGQARACLNIGSYNYLGFADDWQTSCKAAVMPVLDAFNSCMCSSRMDVGTSRLHVELEELVARFVGKEAALVYNMGKCRGCRCVCTCVCPPTYLHACARTSSCVVLVYWTDDSLLDTPTNTDTSPPSPSPTGFGTNSTTIPALVGRGSLIISDTLNHTSIVNGCRASGAHVRTFHHNDSKSLERVLRDSIAKSVRCCLGAWVLAWVFRWVGVGLGVGKGEEEEEKARAEWPDWQPSLESTTHPPTHITQHLPAACPGRTSGGRRSW